MIGDKLIINDYHRTAAALIFEKIKPRLIDSEKVFAVTVAGESGCGKSETAAVLADLCEKDGNKSLILQQDDYFVYPPKTNHNKRLEDISWVGLQEVRLDILEKNIVDIKTAEETFIVKPLVIFEEDRITEDKITIAGVRVVVAEGTYTTTLQCADFKAFINRDFRQTKKTRLLRSRDPATDFLEKVLLIEHAIISGHKETADLIIPPPENETE